MNEVTHGSEVVLHFSLGLASGEVVDSNFGKAPATLTLGDGNLPTVFENCLQGLPEGERQTFRISAADGFGERNPANVMTYARNRFAVDTPLESGLVINFTDAAGNELPGVVSTIEGDQVTVDFNHPLAGHDLVFDVKILSCKPAVK